MFATYLLTGTLAETDFYVLLLLFLGLLLGLFRHMVQPSRPPDVGARFSQHTPHQVTGSGGKLPEQEIVTMAEYKAQKHRLLHS
ncbi:hypothetical protein [uncultured Hymenobacter sp.]|uniref:hypothetical protein n=1 Tax=uncultured Hymenobacter sp. TaxID=170016 RepID=UPI0035CAED71